jgi:hypothetical protein
MKNRLITIGFLFTFSVVVMFMYNTHTQEDLNLYAVACLPEGREKYGQDQKLKDYYHIAHTPREGGRCYFRFPASDVVIMNPRQAQFIQNNQSPTGTWELTYPSSSGRTCFFKNKEKYQGLIEMLRRQPPVNHETYGARVFNDWTQVKSYLLDMVP